MTVEGNKRIARAFFAKLGTDDISTLATFLSDDIAWWTNGARLIPGSPIKRGSEVIEAFAQIPKLFPRGLVVTPTGLTAEKDRVAVEAVSYGVTANGRIYENTYHFALTIREGRIVSGREYMDTLYLKETLF